jgi:hypothetical protein
VKRVHHSPDGPRHHGREFRERIPKPAMQRKLRNEESQSKLARRIKINPPALPVNSHHTAQEFLLLDDAIGGRVRIAFGKKLGGIQRTALLHNAMHEEMILAPEQDNIPAAHIFNGDLPDQGNILRPYPGLHAGAVNTQGNPATPLQRARNAQGIVGAAFTGDPIRFCPVFSSILHQLYRSNSLRRIAKSLSRSEMQKRACAEIRTRIILARSELLQIWGSRPELKLSQLVIPDWSQAGGRSMVGKYWLVQSYSTQSKQFK